MAVPSVPHCGLEQMRLPCSCRCLRDELYRSYILVHERNYSLNYFCFPCAAQRTCIPATQARSPPDLRARFWTCRAPAYGRGPSRAVCSAKLEGVLLGESCHPRLCRFGASARRASPESLTEEEVEHCGDLQCKHFVLQRRQLDVFCRDRIGNLSAAS